MFKNSDGLNRSICWIFKRYHLLRLRQKMLPPNMKSGNKRYKRLLFLRKLYVLLVLHTLSDKFHLNKLLKGENHNFPGYSAAARRELYLAGGIPLLTRLTMPNLLTNVQSQSTSYPSNRSSGATQSVKRYEFH